MLVCGMDLSTTLGSAALLDTARHAEKEAAFSCGYAKDGRRRDASALLLPAAERLLRAFRPRRRVEDIGVFALTTGPGSFTGLRVALASAEGLAFGREGVRVTGVGTLEAAAFAFRGRGGALCPLLNAGRGEIYAALYETRDGELSVEIPPCLVAPEAWAAMLDAGRPILFFGPGLALMAPFLRGRPRWRAGRKRLPLALAAARRAASLLARKAPLPPPELAYVRPPDAKLPAGPSTGSPDLLRPPV